MQAHKAVALALERDKKRLTKALSGWEDDSDSDDAFGMHNSGKQKKNKDNTPKSLWKGARKLMNVKRALVPAATSNHNHLVNAMNLSQFSLPPKSDEKEFVAQVMGFTPLMMKSSFMMKTFIDALYADFCHYNMSSTLSMQSDNDLCSPMSPRTPASRLGVGVMLSEGQGKELLDLTTKMIHEIKVDTARTCWQEVVHPHDSQLHDAQSKYLALKDQLQHSRVEYLREVTALREQMRVRPDPEAVIQGKVLDVTMFFDPVCTLTEAELSFVNQVVSEKVKMIFEGNPAISKTADFGQMERLQQLAQSSQVRMLRSQLMQNKAELRDLKVAHAAKEDGARRASRLSTMGGGGPSRKGTEIELSALETTLQAQVCDLQTKLWKTELELTGQRELCDTLKIEVEQVSGEVGESREAVGHLEMQHQKSRATKAEKNEQKEAELQEMAQTIGNLESDLQTKQTDITGLHVVIQSLRKAIQKKTGTREVVESFTCRNCGAVKDSNEAPAGSSTFEDQSEKTIGEEVEHETQERQAHATKKKATWNGKTIVYIEEDDEGTILHDMLMDREHANMYAADVEARLSMTQENFSSIVGELTWNQIMNDAEVSLNQVDSLAGLMQSLGTAGTIAYGSETLKESEDKCQCGNIFMDDAIFCRKCGTSRHEAARVVAGSSKSSGSSAQVASGGAGEEALTAPQLEARLTVLKAKLKGGAETLEADIKGSTGAAPQPAGDRDQYLSKLSAQEKEVSRLKNERINLESQLLSMRIRGALNFKPEQPNARSVQGDASETPATGSSSICNGKCDAAAEAAGLREALLQIQGLLPPLMEMLKRTTGENAQLREEICAKNLETRQLAKLLENSQLVKTDPWLRQLLDKLRNSAAPSVFDRLYADGQRRNKKQPTPKSEKIIDPSSPTMRSGSIEVAVEPAPEPVPNAIERPRRRKPSNLNIELETGCRASAPSPVAREPSGDCGNPFSVRKYFHAGTDVSTFSTTPTSANTESGMSPSEELLSKKTINGAEAATPSRPATTPAGKRNSAAPVKGKTWRVAGDFGSNEGASCQSESTLAVGSGPAVARAVSPCAGTKPRRASSACHTSTKDSLTVRPKTVESVNTTTSNLSDHLPEETAPRRNRDTLPTVDALPKQRPSSAMQPLEVPAAPTVKARPNSARQSEPVAGMEMQISAVDAKRASTSATSPLKPVAKAKPKATPRLSVGAVPHQPLATPSKSSPLPPLTPSKMG